MLERSNAGKFGSAVFFHDRNDIDIYIEDTAEGYSKIFSNILSKSLGGNLSLERVFPLGCRQKVTEAATKYLNGTNKGNFSVFIVDGDLYLLSGEYDVLPENLIVLHRYCVENFLFDEDAFLKILDEECSDKSYEQLKNDLNFKEWWSSNAKYLRRLFEVYSICHKLKLGIKTVGRGHSEIVLDGNGNVSAEKTQKLIDEIYREINLLMPINDFNIELNEIKKLSVSDYDFMHKYVSAKDYLLPLFLIRFRRHLNNKISNLSIKMRLSNKCSVESMGVVSEKILKIYKNNEN